MRSTARILWLALLFLPALALAQPAPIDPSADPLALLSAFMDALKGGRWLLAVPVAVLLLVGAIRKWGPALIAWLPDESPIDKALTWLLTSRWGGYLLSLSVTVAITLAGAAATGVPLTLAGGLSILFAALAQWIKGVHGDIKESVAIPAPAAGQPEVGSMLNRG